MAQKKDIDWEAIEREYRAGQLSVREIGRQYGVDEKTIRNHAIAGGWERDLTEKVREEVRSQLIRTDSAPTTRGECGDKADKEIVKSAASRAVQVVTLHRSDAQRQREILEDLTRRLRQLIPVEKEESYLTLKDVGFAVKVARDASAAQKNLVTIERQAFNIDDIPPEDEIKRVIIITRRSSVKDEDGDREKD